MSQPVGLTYKSRIPTLADDASIEEALRVYHYGVDSYSGQPIPTDSIEGNFVAIDGKITTVQSAVSTLSSNVVRLISETAAPNIITAQSTTTIPLTVRAIASQTSALQSWQNSSSTVVATMSVGGAIGLAGYLSVGSTSISSTVASNINVINSAHKGIVIKGAGSQTANLQEWQDSTSSVIAFVSPTGAITASGGVSTTTISASTSVSSPSISVTGAQTLDEFRVRNARASTSQPSGGNDGDVWFVYV